jgi:hypothetical protein
MAQHIVFNPPHTDVELLRLRLSLTPGQRLQAMFDARFLLVGMIRGRLRQQYPELSDVELNLKMLGVPFSSLLRRSVPDAECDENWQFIQHY